MTALDAKATIAALDLAPHPEGGWYRQLFKSDDRVTLADGRVRAASTAIYYLLEAGAFSAWHVVTSDEAWHWYDGAPLVLHRLGMPTLTLDRTSPVGIVPAGVWQAAETTTGATLCGCTVAPGFEFDDFAFGTAAELLARFPAERERIERLVKR